MTLPGRKLLLVIALVLVSLGALLALLPVLVSSQIVRQQVANQITAITGSGVTLRGDQALRVFPSPSIEVSDVVV
ncbi:MAG: hypothetical protein KI785_01075, partial [Devosiaceae bacterium]|nr:hypothetical protein [Devosiaceae bacterium MH13]